MPDRTFPETVIVNRSRRLRRLSLTVRGDGTVRLNIPPWATNGQAYDFLKSRENWVIRTREKLAARHREITITDGYKTHFHEFIFEYTTKEDFSRTISDPVVTIGLKSGSGPNDPEAQLFSKTVLREVLRSEAANYLPSRTRELAVRHGLKVGKVTVRDARTRWGSCSSKNNISLNIQLMRLPLHLVDYVILHELTHIRHKDHGAGFYKLLDELCSGKSSELRLEIRNYSPCFN